MKNIIFAAILLPTIACSQGLLVSTSNSTNKMESNVGLIVKQKDNIVISSIQLDSSTVDAINEDINRIVRYYPNPSTTEITIELDFNRIEFFDITGKHVRTVYADSKRVNVSTFEPGTYYISTFKDSNYLTSFKIKKQ